jgi:pimeloyl-ACP methyl ester carboxylesterase
VKPTLRTPHLAGLLRALVDALGLGRVVLLGHSWGGMVVSTFTRLYPERVRALVLLDSGHVDYRDLPGIDASASTEECIERARTQHPSWKSREELTAWLKKDLKRPAPAVLAAYHAAVRNEDGAVIGTAADVLGAARTAGACSSCVARPSLVEHRIPTILILAAEPPH